MLLIRLLAPLPSRPPASPLLLLLILMLLLLLLYFSIGFFEPPLHLFSYWRRIFLFYFFFVDSKKMPSSIYPSPSTRSLDVGLFPCASCSAWGVGLVAFLSVFCNPDCHSFCPGNRENSEEPTVRIFFLSLFLCCFVWFFLSFFFFQFVKKKIRDRYKGPFLSPYLPLSLSLPPACLFLLLNQTPTICLPSLKKREREKNGQE